MAKHVDPRRFVGKHMALRSEAPGDASVMIDGLRAGRIMQQVRSGQRVIYFWTLTAPYTIAAGINAFGEEDTLDNARMAIRSAFDMWMIWALAQENPVVWYG
jgi:hypothetical protein